MANVFLTPDVIAREALLQTEDHIVFSNSIMRGYSQDWEGAKKGDTIRIRDISTLVATDFNGTINYQDNVETSVPLKIEKHLHVAVPVTSKQWTLEIEDFSMQIVKPAVKALVKGMEQYALSQVKKVSNYAENVSGVPASGKDVAELEAQAWDSGFPSSDPVWYLMNARTKAGLITADGGKMYDASVRADGGAAFRTANFGTILGISGLVSNLMEKKEVSTADGETGTTAGAVAKTSTAVLVTVDGLTAGVEVEEADILEFTNLDGSIVRASVKTGVTATGTGDVVEVFYLDAGLDAGATFEVKSIGLGCVYNSNAFALATIPLEPLMSVENDFIFDPQIGMGIRVSYQPLELGDGVVFDSLAGADHINHDFAFRTDLV